MSMAALKKNSKRNKILLSLSLLDAKEVPIDQLQGFFLICTVRKEFQKFRRQGELFH